MFTTGGTVTDNLAVSPNDVAVLFAARFRSIRVCRTAAARSTLYNLNPNVFGQVNNLIRSTKDVGDDTRVFNGVDVNLNVRGADGFTFTGGTSTGKVVNDWCEIRAAVPESYMLNPYCHTESPWQTSFRRWRRIRSRGSTCRSARRIQDKPNVGTDQVVSLPATYTLTPADQAAAAAQIGRPLTSAAALQVNLLARASSTGPAFASWTWPPRRFSASAISG